MPVHTSQSPTIDAARAPFEWVILPAVVMSLGWGLRGYIGGGPLGAMIPGALLAILLCQNLGIHARAAAAVAAFSAIGIGFGGEMTYGQTLGLLLSSDTFWWGLLGTTLKGAVWGMLGGAMLGLGLVVHRLSMKSLLFGLLCLLAGAIVGLHFINQPKLLYFSDPINHPRDESWAGLLLGATALLIWLQAFEPKVARAGRILAVYGACGGAVGFGGGSLLLAMQPELPTNWQWLPCWKFMEFAFGAILGAALGLATRSLRPTLAETIKDNPESDSPRSPDATRLIGVTVGALLVAGVFLGWFGQLAPLELNWQSDSLDDPRKAIARVLLGFMGLGCVLVCLSRRWELVAWQMAISVTIVAAAIDWQRDLISHGHIELAPHYRALFVVSIAMISILFVACWRTGARPRLASLACFALCVLMAIGYLMGLADAGIWRPQPQQVAAYGGRLPYYWQTYRSEFLVHAIFTTLFIISLRGVRSGRAREASC